MEDKTRLSSGNLTMPSITLFFDDERAVDPAKETSPRLHAIHH